MSSPAQQPGGFTLPSPPASSISSPRPGTVPAGTLPSPRHTPLKPGGPKESTLIRHIDSRMLHIQRRFAKRTSPRDPSTWQATTEPIPQQTNTAPQSWPTDVQGYKSMREACKDISELVSVIWVSGTPSLQIPYLITLALLLADIVRAMPPTPRAMFKTLDQLDRVFASLLTARDVQTGIPLPGFDRGRGVSGTEKVRIRSLVERTRVSVAEVVGGGGEEAEEEEAGVGDETDGELVLEGDRLEEDDGVEEQESWDVAVSRVYDRTVVELGGSLEAPSIGIITEGRG
ncbi:hypothetical protein MBLNU230_g5535t1 [Neophaeotheca triangularis]